jgi:hypothetical protein
MTYHNAQYAQGLEGAKKDFWADPASSRLNTFGGLDGGKHPADEASLKLLNALHLKTFVVARGQLTT